jgi:[NiFe] hydrogenase assembly HybE family chaperone
VTSSAPVSFDADVLKSRMEAAFRRAAEERMTDVPILNPALSVAAAGVRPVENAWLTVLVTPWCINLMLLPGDSLEASRWAALPSGAKVKRQFPAGAFEFTIGAEEALGPYQMCSLFSPVLEFETQEAALLTAEAALEVMFDAALHPESKKEEASGVSRRHLIFGGAKS